MIIAFMGKKRSGKDTASDYVCDKYGFIRYSFASPIKNGVKELFGFSEEQVNGELKDVVDKHWGVTPRLVLQIMGTEVFQYFLPEKIKELKKINKYFWVHRFLPFYDENHDKNIVISDVRFQHEVDSIHKLGGKIIKITRDYSDNLSDSHASEKDIDLINNYDFVIENNSTISNFNKNISIKIEKVINAL